MKIEYKILLKLSSRYKIREYLEGTFGRYLLKIPFEDTVDIEVKIHIIPTLSQ